MHLFSRYCISCRAFIDSGLWHQKQFKLQPFKNTVVRIPDVYKRQQKYNNYSNQAQDPQLKKLFKSYAGQEQNHFNTINQILNGQTPNIGQQQGQQNQAQGGMQNQAQSGMQSQAQNGMQNQNDATLCTDMLMTEKFVSNAYDTAIFEFKDEMCIRDSPNLLWGQITNIRLILFY